MRDLKSIYKIILSVALIISFYLYRIGMISQSLSSLILVLALIIVLHELFSNHYSIKLIYKVIICLILFVALYLYNIGVIGQVYTQIVTVSIMIVILLDLLIDYLKNRK